MDENSPQIGFNVQVNNDSPPSYSEVQDSKINKPHGSSLLNPLALDNQSVKINKPTLQPLPPIHSANITPQTTIINGKKTIHLKILTLLSSL